ncbi:hypothetical protein CDCA_CDCA17G4370 [Cyanidium caldarium]|uniref:Mitochondrial phosphate carrier protein n=1 Tax=Cyanidium caldarium TaxID=2771 RepID=A0AAV9J1Y5_CYACA|nr:hypothetical protein CDCA_CDCA17G4370 [Cyanidium caldarium]
MRASETLCLNGIVQSIGQPWRDERAWRAALTPPPCDSLRSVFYALLSHRPAHQVTHSAPASSTWAAASPDEQVVSGKARGSHALESAPTQMQSPLVYLKYALGGAVGTGLTHSSVVPVDVVKTRLQVSNRYHGMLDATRTIVKEEGLHMLLQGLGPTAVGYFMQGFFKFGGYEFFKAFYSSTVAQRYGLDEALKWRFGIWMVGGASAEVIADVFLAPMEAVRIRLISHPSYAKGLADGFVKLAREEGAYGLWRGLPPLMFRQVPYTVAKFAVYEITTEAIYHALERRDITKDDLSGAQRNGLSLLGGLCAGAAAAVSSQPADTVLSALNKEADGSVPRILRELGVRGLFRGMGARAIMVMTLTAAQFGIFDFINRQLGLKK